jgi:hypothetical protein
VGAQSAQATVLGQPALTQPDQTSKRKQAQLNANKNASFTYVYFI